MRHPTSTGALESGRLWRPWVNAQNDRLARVIRISATRPVWASPFARRYARTRVTAAWSSSPGDALRAVAGCRCAYSGVSVRFGVWPEPPERLSTWMIYTYVSLNLGVLIRTAKPWPNAVDTPARRRTMYSYWS